MPEAAGQEGDGRVAAQQLVQRRRGQADRASQHQVGDLVERDFAVGLALDLDHQRLAGFADARAGRLHV
jgi:hypothetical protein